MKDKRKPLKGNDGSGLLGKATRAKKKRKNSIMDFVNAGMGKKKRK